MRKNKFIVLIIMIFLKNIYLFCDTTKIIENGNWFVNITYLDIRNNGEKENVLKIYKNNILIRTLDYTSEDGQHGYCIDKYYWTENGRYFLFSMYSSGGHQPWFTPFFAYDTKENKLIDIDKNIGQIRVKNIQIKNISNIIITCEDFLKNIENVNIIINLDELK